MYLPHQPACCAIIDKVNPAEIEPLRVAIAGAGCSGSLVAAHLLRQNQPVQVDLIDPRIPGRGLAYSTVWDQHLLNVRAARMSAFGSEPSHFLDWLRANGYPHATPDTFAPRKVFGGYLQDILQSSIQSASLKHRYRHHGSKAVRISHDGAAAQVWLENGDRIAADRVVLATGNPAPRPLRVEGGQYFNSPWDRGALTGLNPNAGVLLLGSGLTAVDAFLAFEAQGHQGTIYCLSRRGKLSHVHTVYRKLPEPFVPQDIGSARHLLRALRLRVEDAERQGYDWRAVIDSLRPITNELWVHFSPMEQARVLRHLKTWWDIHRHRMAPEIGLKLKQALARGQLRVYAGRLAHVAAEHGKLQVDIRLRSQGDLSLTVDRLINCTGSEEDYQRVPNPLLKSLLDAGRIQPNPTGKGFHSLSEWLFTLGPPRIGDLFETTAVPELRIQAEALANQLVSTPYEPIETPVDYFMAAGI
jgi:uncharacterized NAD(P)/FAD-binding protein YdhS